MSPGNFFMDELLFILIAASVGALVWAGAYALTSTGTNRKRKIHQRLSVETRSDSEHRVLRPLTLSAQSGGASSLDRVPLVPVLRRRLAQAYPELTLANFLIISAVAGAFLSIMTGLLGGMAGALGGAAVGGYLPFLFVSVKRGRRQRQITRQLPEALDFLSRVLRSGQSFSTGLQIMSEELPPPLSLEFRRCYDQHSLGQPIEEGLRETAMRLESTDFAFFATAVVIQRQSGGDMAEVLRNISNMIRQRLQLQQSVKAKTAEGRFTGYIMLVFPVVMFVITGVLSPERGSVLLHTSEGHWLLGIAAGLQLVGLYFIRTITTVRV